MEPIILQSFSDINCFDTATFFEFARIKDKLMCATSARVCVEDRVVGYEAGHDIVGIEKCYLGGVGQANATHHADVSSADWENGSAAPRCGTNRRYSVLRPVQIFAACRLFREDQQTGAMASASSGDL